MKIFRKIKTTFSTPLEFLNSMFVSMSCTNNPPHNDQCDITLSKAWSSSSKPFLKSMHCVPLCVLASLSDQNINSFWKHLARFWASFITHELFHNAKIEALNKCEKDTLLWVEISLQKQHWCHLFAQSCNAFGWDSHNTLRRIKSMMFT